MTGVTTAAPAEAQRSFEPLFDKFNFKVAGSWVAMTTEIRLDFLLRPKICGNLRRLLPSGCSTYCEYALRAPQALRSG